MYYDDSDLSNDQLKSIVKRFHCTREEAGSSTIAYVLKWGEKIRIGYSATLPIPRESVLEEYRFSNWESADLRATNLIKKYLEEGYVVESDTSGLYIHKKWNYPE